MVDEKLLDIFQKNIDAVMQTRAPATRPNGSKSEFVPFYASLTGKDPKKLELEVKNGSTIIKDERDHIPIGVRFEIRMGDYEKGGGSDSDTMQIPKDLNRDAYAEEMWRTMNSSFWYCASDYEDRFSSTLGVQDEEDMEDEYLYFSRERPNIHIGENTERNVDVRGIEEMMQEATRRLFTDDLYDVQMYFGLDSEDRYYLNSENTRLFSSDTRYKMSLEMQMVDERGLIVPFSFKWSERDRRNLNNIPDIEEIMERGQEVREILSEIVAAPYQPNGEFPTILCPANHGVLWHEVVGHGLEAHRMKGGEMDEDISVFKDMIGKRVAPSFITVYDDPLMEGASGSYMFDEEGVAAQCVRLFYKGILENYLHSRESAGLFGTQSNGHARAAGIEDPVARMSNLVIESSNEVSFDQLVENCKRECVNQGKEYGLFLKTTLGGMTMPDECVYETYPAEVFRVYPHSDKMERMRNVYIVGTPYQTMNNIIQTSDEYETWNGYCGAESGPVPASETAPHALVRSLEVNAIPKQVYQRTSKPVIPKPE